MSHLLIRSHQRTWKQKTRKTESGNQTIESIYNEQISKLQGVPKKYPGTKVCKNEDISMFKENNCVPLKEAWLLLQMV